MFDKSRELKAKLVLSTGLLGTLATFAAPVSAQSTPQTPTVQQGGDVDFRLNGNPTVTLGNGQTSTDIDGSAGSLAIDLSDTATIIDWQSFNIADGSSVAFNGSQGAAVLNRVTGLTASQLAGSLTANGVSLFLINPEGIIVGGTGTISSASFVASTLSLDDTAFNSGLASGTFGFGSSATANGVLSVATGATITAGGGDYGLLLVAPSISTSGALTTTTEIGGNRDIAFVTANAVDVTFTSGSPLSISISEGTRIAGGTQMIAGTVNGENVYMAIASQSSMLNTLLSIEDDAMIVTTNGRGIFLTAGQNVDARIAGILTAQGTGGAIDIDIVGNLALDRAELSGNANVAIQAGSMAVTTSSISSGVGAVELSGGLITLNGESSLAAAPETALTIDAATDVISNTAFEGGMGDDDNLRVTAGGQARFLASVGATSAIQSLTVEGAAQIGNVTITTLAGQEWQGAVTLTGDATVTDAGQGGSTLDFGSTIDGAFALTLGAAAASTLAGNINIGSLIINGGGSTTLGGSTITTSGTQSFADDILLTSAAATFTSSGNAEIAFRGVLGAQGTAVTVGTGGNTLFVGNVGATDALGSLTTNGGGTTRFGAAGGTRVDVRTTGTQDYQDAVELLADTQITSTASGTISLDRAISGRALSLTSAGAITFGSADAIAASEIVDVTSLRVAGGGETTVIMSRILTDTFQDFGNDLVVRQNTVFESATDQDIAFGGKLNGAFEVTVDTAGLTTFDGRVGDTDALTRLVFDGAGEIAINGGMLKVSTDQTFNEAVELGEDATLTNTGDGFFLFENMVDGPGGLRVLTQGAVDFLDTIGATEALAFLDLPSGAGSGPIRIGSGLVRTRGGQTYGRAVRILRDTMLESTGGGDISFLSTLDGGFDLDILTAGNTSFVGDVGGIARLVDLTIDGAGFGTVNFGFASGTDGATLDPSALFSITTSGKQTFGDAVVIGRNTLIKAGGEVDFADTINDLSSGAAAGLTIDTALDTRLRDAGTADRLAFLEVLGGGRTLLRGSRINTIGRQIYDDVVGLVAFAGFDEVILNSTNGDLDGRILFRDTVDGSAGLRVTTANLTAFNRRVGATTALGFLTVDGDGQLELGNGLVGSGTVMQVRTQGDQFFGDATTLWVDTELTSMAQGRIEFGSTLDSDTLGLDRASGLLVQTGGQTIFRSTVGGIAALGSIRTDAVGRTLFNAAGGTLIRITTEGSQDYGDAVELLANVEMVSRVTDPSSVSGLDEFALRAVSNDVTFGQTADGPGGLEVVASGVKSFNGVGTASALAYLISRSDASNPLAATLGLQPITVLRGRADGVPINDAASVRTVGRQSLDAVQLLGDNRLESVNAGDITFNLRLDGERNLIVRTAGRTDFQGVVGGISALASLLVDGGGLTNIRAGGDAAALNDPARSGRVFVNGDQTYLDNVELEASIVVTSLRGGDITFGGRLNGPGGLTATTLGSDGFGGVGTTRFLNDIGSLSPLRFLTTDGTGRTQFGSSGDTSQLDVRTLGNQLYLDAVDIFAPTLIVADGANPIGTNLALAATVRFASTVDGPNGLVVNARGLTSFEGAVGANTPLFLLDTGLGGTTRIAGGSVTTDGGGQDYFSDRVEITCGVASCDLSETVLRDIDGGDIIFARQLDSIAGVNARLAVLTSGTTIFSGAVGGRDALRSLRTDAPGTTAFFASTFGSGVTTTGEQSFADNVTVGRLDGFTGDATWALTSTGGADINFGGTVNSAAVSLASQLIEADPGLFVRPGTNPADAEHYGIRVTTSGRTRFALSVGAVKPLASIETDIPGSTVFGLAGGSAISVNTTTFQTYRDDVMVAVDATFSSTQTGSITFDKLLDGAFNVQLNTAGVTAFNGAVGSQEALASLGTDAPGSVAINGGRVTTTGSQIFRDPARVGAPSTAFTSTGDAAITFGSTLDGAAGLNNDVVVNTGGVTTFVGFVGGLDALRDLTTDAVGTTIIRGLGVRTTRHQTYNDAVKIDPATVSAATVLTSTGSAAETNINFARTLDGPGALSIVNAGTTRFGGAVGGITALASLTTDAGGLTRVEGGLVRTTGEQQFGDNVRVTTNTAFVSRENGAITFGALLDGAFGVNVNTGGVTTFGAAVGSVDALASLATDNQEGEGERTVIAGPTVTTTGAQTYGDAVELVNTISLTSMAAGNIAFQRTLNLAQSLATGVGRLTVTTSGDTVFAGAVGGLRPLLSLTTDAPGRTLINGGRVVTIEDQTYNDDILLGTDTLLIGRNGFFQRGLEGQTHDLSLRFSGDLTELVGGAMRARNIDNLLVDGTGILNLRGDLVTLRGQTYQSRVRLFGNTTLVAQGNGSIVFSNSLDGAFSLGLTADGDTVALNGVTGGTTRLGILSANAGSVRIDNARTASAGIGAGTVTIEALDAAGTITSNSTGMSTIGTATASGDVRIISGGALMVSTLLNSSSGDVIVDAESTSRIERVTAGRDVDINSAGLLTLGSLTAVRRASIVVPDIALNGALSAQLLILTNRDPANRDVLLGPGASGDANFSLDQAEINRINVRDLFVNAAGADVRIGTLTFDENDGSVSTSILTNANILIDGTVTGTSGSNRRFTFGGTLIDNGGTNVSVNAAATSLAGNLVGRATADRAGVIGLGPNNDLVLNAGRIAFGQDNLLAATGLDPVDASLDQDVPLATIANDLLSRSNSVLYNPFASFATVAGTPYAPGESGGGPNLVLARSMTVRYTNFALFQNTGAPGQRAGVALGSGGQLGNLALSLSDPRTLPGSPAQNAFAMFGTIAGFPNEAAAVLGSTVLVFDDTIIRVSDSRINGCIIGSAAGCLTTPLAQPALNIFDPSRLDVLTISKDFQVAYDPVVSSTNESLYTGLPPLPAEEDEDEDDR